MTHCSGRASRGARQAAWAGLADATVVEDGRLVAAVVAAAAAAVEAAVGDLLGRGHVVRHGGEYVGAGEKMEYAAVAAEQLRI